MHREILPNMVYRNLAVQLKKINQSIFDKKKNNVVELSPV